jgi:uncharacterized membrane protein YqjE
MIAATVGSLILGALALWFFGGLLLRLAGLLIFVAGVVGAARGNAGGVLVAALGALGWLAGHWHYALRHQEYKSPLARRLFSRWALSWLDPTRDWSVPVDRGGGKWSR